MPPRREMGMVLPEGVDLDNLPDMKTLRKMLKNQNKNNKKTSKDNTLKRIIGYVLGTYKLKAFIVLISIIIAAVANSSTSIIVTNLINNVIKPGNLDLLPSFLILAGSIFIAGTVASATQSILMSIIVQGTLNTIRKDLFFKMQKLPLSYFDTHQHGNIMSVYTNDVDTLRQFISQTFTTLISSIITLVTLVSIMVYYSLYLCAVVIVGVVIMVLVTRYIGGSSARYFMLQQHELGKLNGFIEESMHGQKVVQVFGHEEDAKKDFDKLNENLCKTATEGNKFANTLMPVMGNIGNILYVLVAIVGFLIMVFNISNVGIVSLINPEESMIGITVGFLTISKSFSMTISNLSQQINFFAQALAGGRRIFSMMDENQEEDNGYVTLVNAMVLPDGSIIESEERTGVWAWRHPHQAEGNVTYTLLKGDITMHDVDFAYVPGKTVLHDISLYAKPGQRIAFVGATGAGKTTITNLLTRFYDIEDGKIRYDGININKIKKADLRRSLGLVLQETNLFTGTIMDNIRYGNESATEEDVINAAKLANAHDFITRLPDGYNTMLESDGANLSQGQRQLLSIARTACENAPVLILDEATSSIDTRTEALVQKGMDSLMQGRTVFVIAHRLSTVQNSDVIMVLDKGRIIERGTHNELIAAKGIYNALYTGAFELE